MIGQRIRDEKDSDHQSHKQPYWVHRWRISEGSGRSTRCIPSSTCQATDQEAQGPSCHGTGQPPRPRMSDPPELPLQAANPGPVDGPKIPLPTDQDLIHLISHNVCRGLMSNKSILRLLASYINAVHDPPLHPELAAGCEVAVLRPGHQTMPPCLVPTQLQMNSPHPTWMDIFPFPEFRNNLIRQQYSFNHKILLRDLVGDLVHLMPPPEQGALQEDPVNGEDAPNSSGLILWGEPHLKESWEATPRFLQKWAWATEGCEEIFSISNGWRATRGDSLLGPPIRNWK
ncbi:hypothetical protein ACJZ2D_005233 [Fusarium nematophilum]